MSSDIVERIPISQVAYNAGLEIRYAIASSGVDPIQHIPEVDAIIERRLVEAREAALEEAAKVAEAEPEFEGDPPQHVVDAMISAGPIENARSACRATKKGIAAAIRTLHQKEREA